MTDHELREKFLTFFKEKNHSILPSAPLIPENDPTVLFTTAGMHPLVPFLLGEFHPGGRRLVNVQKCIRTGDIDEVGDDTHLTFFEMLGNWSLGDYFKKEAIEWSFEFLTREQWLHIPLEKLAVTVFEGGEGIPKDDESVSIWKSLGIPEHKIAYLSRANNWWGPAGQTGPCGPDTEMFYFVGTGAPRVESNPRTCPEEWVEIWNDVFMEYTKTPEGDFQKLVHKNVDTGMGLERVIALLQGERSPFETDLFLPIIHTIEELSGKNYTQSIEIRRMMRIIADHLRAATFILGDERGVVPSNVDQGYVLRKLIRRSIRLGRQLGIRDLFTASIADKIVERYCRIYPELGQNREHIRGELEREEKKFSGTLSHGLSVLENMVRSIHRLEHVLGVCLKEVPDDADDRLFLEQLLGAPWLANREDIKAILAAAALKEVQESSRQFIERFLLSGSFLFTLYTQDGFPAELAEEVIQSMATEHTHAGDLSFSLRFDHLEFEKLFKEHQLLSRTGARQKFAGGLADHSAEVIRMHTATHLLHQALRSVLGSHVFQKGSNITAERLRFDFSHTEKMTEEQKKKVEDVVNEVIKCDLPVHFEELTVSQAKERGAIGLFDDKYAQLGNKLKVYFIGDETKGYFSKEICGGPHVEHTGLVGHFSIKKEEAVAAGVRRIKAVVE